MWRKTSTRENTFVKAVLLHPCEEKHMKGTKDIKIRARHTSSMSLAWNRPC